MKKDLGVPIKVEFIDRDPLVVNEAIDDYMNLEKRYKDLIDEFVICPFGMYTLPEGFITNAKTVVLGEFFEQELSNQIMPSTVTNLQMKRSYNYQKGIPSSLIKLDLVTHLHKIPKLPPNLKSLSISYLSQPEDKSIFPPDSLTEVTTGCLNLLVILPDTVSTLDFTNELDLAYFSPVGMPNNIKSLKFICPQPNHFQLLSRNLVDLTIMFSNDYPINLGDNNLCLPPSLTSVKLHQFYGNICKGALPISGLKDMQLIFSGVQDSLQECFIPMSVTRLLIYFCSIKKFPKHFSLPNSITDLDINCQNKDIIKKHIPMSVEKLVIGNLYSPKNKSLYFSKIPTQLSVGRDLTHLSLFFSRKTKLKSNMFPSCLTFLSLNIATDSVDIQLEPNLLSHIGNLEVLLLGPIKVLPGSIPSCVTKLALDLSHSWKLEANVIPKSVRNLILKSTTTNSISLDKIPNSVEALRLNAYGGYETLDHLSDSLKYIDYGPHFTCPNFDGSKFKLLTHIKNFPLIYSAPFHFPPNLISLHMTPKSYGHNFIAKSLSFPNIPYIQIK
ncbi:hypothetical protein CYY_005535 [Polysphondylium violaceum]|uniref:FNIP repeat-containing protein n=1 Tax=Polysphondylium violaceum TaxID=133409 RepID=A0A8J4PTM2_9MYCE|nr:hypothetical protein CYY_005535 [Polysphondylium violaceum]